MNIEFKQNNGKFGGILLIMQFKDQEELDVYLGNLECYSEFLKGEERDAFDEIIDTIGKRVDGKYKNGEYALSGALFEKEAADFVWLLNRVCSSAYTRLMLHK